MVNRINIMVLKNNETSVWFYPLLSCTLTVIVFHLASAWILIQCAGSKTKKKTDTKTEPKTTNDASERVKDDKPASKTKTVNQELSKEVTEDKPGVSMEPLEAQNRPSHEQPLPVPPIHTSGIESNAPNEKDDEQGSKDPAVEPVKQKDAKKKKHKKKKKKKHGNKENDNNNEGETPKQEVVDVGKTDVPANAKLVSNEKGEVGVEVKGSTQPGDEVPPKSKTEASNYQSAKTNIEKTEDASKFKSVMDPGGPKSAIKV